ncbi:MAG: potassium transporter TrkG, partial [Aphanizomenon sp.]
LISYQSSPLVILTIGTLIIFGGIGYQVILDMYLWLRDSFTYQSNRIIKKTSFLTFSLDFKVATSTTLIVLILGTIALFLIEIRNDSTFGKLNLSDKLLVAWFQSVTTRTAGFNSIDIGKMTNAGLFIMIALMFIGAS